MNNENTATTNTILVILLVIVVGFIVWFAVGRGNTASDATPSSPSATLQVNLPDSNSGATTGGAPAQ